MPERLRKVAAQVGHLLAVDRVDRLELAARLRERKAAVVRR